MVVEQTTIGLLSSLPSAIDHSSFSIKSEALPSSRIGLTKIRGIPQGQYETTLSKPPYLKPSVAAHLGTTRQHTPAKEDHPCRRNFLIQPSFTWPVKLFMVNKGSRIILHIHILASR